MQFESCLNTNSGGGGGEVFKGMGKTQQAQVEVVEKFNRKGKTQGAQEVRFIVDSM